MSATPLSAERPGLFARLWIYQAERFPLVAHGALVLAFSGCAVSLSAHLRDGSLPSVGALVIAFVSCLAFFAQLRIADEFKDHDEDARYRPYRPVPRGLVSLRELGALFIVAGAVQLALAWHGPAVQRVLLFVTWAYLAGMCVEFGCRDWLKARPTVYLWSHMLIMPLVDLYATATDWAVAGGAPPVGLMPFLAASCANGFVLEIGRKIRAPGDEEHGVETWSRVWGQRRAVGWWLFSIACCFAFGVATAAFTGAVVPVAAVLAVAAGWAVFTGWRFIAGQPGRSGTSLETASAIWTLALYLGLGLVPHFYGA